MAEFASETVAVVGEGAGWAEGSFFDAQQFFERTDGAIVKKPREAVDAP